MSCFSMEGLKELLIFFVVIIVAVAIFRVIVPWVLGMFGPAPPGGAQVMTVLGYILWGIVAIAVIIFAFNLFECAFSGGAVAPFGNFGRVR